MEWWQILLYAISIILVIYAFGLFYALECILTFKERIRKKTLAISILLSEKKDVLISLYGLMKNDIHDKSILDNLEKVNSLNLDKLKAKDIEDSLIILTTLQKQLVMFANSTEYKTSENYNTYFDILSDLDTNYRKLTAVFNSDITGYDYWRKTPLFRGVFFIFGFREIKRLP